MEKLCFLVCFPWLAQLKVTYASQAHLPRDVVPLTVDWAFEHQLATKNMLHRRAHRPTCQRQFPLAHLLSRLEELATKLGYHRKAATTLCFLSVTCVHLLSGMESWKSLFFFSLWDHCRTYRVISHPLTVSESNDVVENPCFCSVFKNAPQQSRR